MGTKKLRFLATALCFAITTAVAQNTSLQEVQQAGEKFYKEGHYAEAETKFLQALKTAEKSGNEDASLADSLYGLAATYAVQGKYGAAEPLLKRSLLIRQNLFGQQSTEVAQTLYKLGQVYAVQENFGDAQTVLRQSATIREQLFGPDHPDVANSVYTLAMSFMGQLKLAEAEPLLQRALAIREKALGPEHPDVVKVLEAYILVLREMKRTSEAQTLEARVKAIRGKANPGSIARRIFTNDDFPSSSTQIAPTPTAPPDMPQRYISDWDTAVKSGEIAAMMRRWGRQTPAEYIGGVLGDLANVYFTGRNQWENRLYSMYRQYTADGELCFSNRVSDMGPEQTAACKRFDLEAYRIQAMIKEGRDAAEEEQRYRRMAR